jgi:peptidoglycan/xylan/chitin deacetylase (PgdA/CDA1 family)
VIRILALLLAVALPFAPSHAEQACPRAGTLGTSRILPVDAAATPRVGRKHFPVTLPLAPKEVVLTFDDGPWPGTTARVLDALRAECVKAVFFLLGRNAAAHPAIAQRIRAEGHTLGHHTFAHPLLDRLPLARAEAEIDRGIAAIDKAAYPAADGTVARFFRFPGFASSPALLERLRERGIVVFGADLWASDWNPMTPSTELQLVLARLRESGGGIVLFHDTKSQTAAMLPAFLRALRSEGYRVVLPVPADRH